MLTWPLSFKDDGPRRGGTAFLFFETDVDVDDIVITVR